MNEWLSCFNICVNRYVDDHRLCCYFNNLDQCITEEKQPLLFQCGSMMQNTLLKSFTWLVGSISLFGNGYVFSWQLKLTANTDTQITQRIFTLNLAVSDLLMGVYMILLSCVDVYYGDQYFQYSDIWRESVGCRFVGFLTLVSGETSLLLLTVITVDRYLHLVFPFSSRHFKKTSASIIVACVWLFTIVLSLSASIIADPDSDYYALSDVCIGLPLVSKSPIQDRSYLFKDSMFDRSFGDQVDVNEVSWYFSIVVFLGLNFSLSLVIIILYTITFVSVRKSRRAIVQTPNVKKELKMALRMIGVAMSNFLCWFPVALIGILSQLDLVALPLDAFIWIVVFIVPINAAMNPILYTLLLRI